MENTSVMSRNQDALPQLKVKDSEKLSLGRLQLELSHKENMADKELLAKELELEEKKHQLVAQKAEKTDRLRDEKRKQQQERLAQRKQTFVRRFRKLVEELVEYGQDFEWEIKDVEALLKKSAALQESIEDFCDEKLFIDYEDLLIWDILELIREEVSDLYKEWSSRILRARVISFDLDDDLMEELESAAELEDFHTPVPDDDDEEDEEDSEDEDDDEDMDEDDDY